VTEEKKMKSLGHCKVSGVTEKEKEKKSRSLQGVWSDRKEKREVVSVNAKKGVTKIKQQRVFVVVFVYTSCFILTPFLKTNPTLSVEIILNNSPCIKIATSK
jgi:hypothetical protein